MNLSLLNPFTRLTLGLPGGILDGDAYFFGYTLLPWWGVAIHQHVLQNLSVILTTIANNTTNSLTNLQKSLDSLANVVFDNRLALVYLLAKQGGVWQLPTFLVAHTLTPLPRYRPTFRKHNSRPPGFNRQLTTNPHYSVWVGKLKAGSLTCSPGSRKVWKTFWLDVSIFL